MRHGRYIAFQMAEVAISRNHRLRLHGLAFAGSEIGPHYLITVPVVAGSDCDGDGGGGSDCGGVLASKPIR
jgi:hypothetical protein